MMASYDIRAQEILDSCRELNIAVPDQVAVVGVDNDPIICNLAFPSLTSVIPDAVQAGYMAAELLQRMMQGECVPADAHLLPPLGIATRQSTDVLAVDDPDVAAAAKYIRDHAREGITVADVLKHVPLSRRALESRFKKITVGRRTMQSLASDCRMSRGCSTRPTYPWMRLPLELDSSMQST